MKKFKITKTYKKLLILTWIYIIFACVISISVIAAINNSLNVHSPGLNNNFSTQTNYNSNKNNELLSKNKSQDTNKVIEKKLTNIPQEAGNISFSSDGKYCVYLYNKEIYIKDIASDNIINNISDTVPVTNFILMNDRNIIIYFTSGNSFLNLYNFNIDTNIKTFQKKMDIPLNSTVKNFDYSNLLAQVIFNLEIVKGNNIISRIYRMDVLKGLHILDNIPAAIKNLILLNDTYTLYLEDNNNNLYCYPTPINEFNKRKIYLLGCDINDNTYIQSAENKNDIYVLKNKKISKTIKLNDPNYIEIYTNKIGVYAVYNNYIINLAGDINKKLTFDNNLKFIGIGGNKIYFKDLNNNIIWKSMDI